MGDRSSPAEAGRIAAVTRCDDNWSRGRTMAKVTGIGGVFFKSRSDSAALVAWYQKHLAMPIESWGGAILRWPEDKANDDGLTVWHVAEKDSKWFSPSDSLS